MWWFCSLQNAQGQFSNSPKLDFLAFLDCSCPSWYSYCDWYCRRRKSKTVRSCFRFMCCSPLLQPSSPRAPWLTAVFPGLSVWPWALRFAVDTWGHAGRRRVIMRRCPGLLLPNLPSSSFASLPFALSCRPSPLLFIIASSLRWLYLGAIFEFSLFLAASLTQLQLSQRHLWCLFFFYWNFYIFEPNPSVLKDLGLKAWNTHHKGTYKEFIEIIKSASKYMHCCKCSLDLQFPNERAVETFTNPINFCPLCFLYLAAEAVLLSLI